MDPDSHSIDRCASQPSGFEALILDQLGAVLLDGSGFELETSEPEFDERS